MRRALVTGCAGFIGSHLSERLVELGWDVVGVDGFTSTYSRRLKEDNLSALRDWYGFEFHELDLASAPDLGALLDGVDVVWHLAARAGVRASFSQEFSAYMRDNLLATERLLAAASSRDIERFVYASSSSVYGDAETMPTPENVSLLPRSPYGLSKVAVEGIADRYHYTRGVRTVGLRYFTAYGPRQRPDMAFTRFITAGMAGRPIDIFGDGLQRRDFTYVDDVVEATISAGERGVPGRAYNVGGGQPVRLIDAIGEIAGQLGRPLNIRHHETALGDARDTSADDTLCLRDLGFSPSTPLSEGLAAQVAWAEELEPLLAAA